VLPSGEPGPGPGPAGPGGALSGSRCPDCAVTTYPAQPRCPRCGAALRERALSRHGRLWSWTVQRHPPKSPPYVPPATGFEPFAVGYVELPEGVRVAAILDVPLDDLTIGLPVRIGTGAGVPRAAVARPAELARPGAGGAGPAAVGAAEVGAAEVGAAGLGAGAAGAGAAGAAEVGAGAAGSTAVEQGAARR
jgi:uncharacterized OB-fold protein